MHYRLISRFSFWMLLVAVTCCTHAFSQTITADIGGTVTDGAGLVVAGATVTAMNVDTSVSVSAATNANGIFSIRFLQVGQYNVFVEAAGFKKEQVGPFALESGQIAKVDVKLTVGSTSSTVEVSGTFAPLLNAENATLDSVFSSNVIENMPLNGEMFSSVTLFLPGAVTTNYTAYAGNQGIERDTGSGPETSINGGRNQQNNYLLDGVEINETINNTIGYNPYPDSLQELRVISSNAPAEFGNVNGGDVLMVTKSGTNLFHGSISDHLEDYELDANTWLNKHEPSGTAAVPRTPYTEALFGGTIGGPITIPHLLHGRDKLFFFGDFEGARYHSGGVANYSVLSALMRQGNFSELLNPALMCGGCSNPNKLIQLYDSENNFAPYPGDLNIPITNPVYAYLVAHPNIYPMPNQAPTADSPVANNFRGPTSTHRHNNQGDIKIDYTPTQKDRFSGRYTQGKAGDISTNPLPTSFLGSNTYPDKGMAFNWVRSFTPALVNEYRMGYSRVRWQSGIPTDPSGVFGLKGDNLVGIPGTQPFPGFAAQTTSGYSLSNIGTSGGATQIIDNTFSYSDDLTWQHGKHLFKAGIQLLRYQQNQFYAGNDGAMGTFTYNGNYTSNPTVIAAANPNAYAGTGFSIADFVLDRVEFEGVGAVTGNTGQRQWRDAYFGQDDWKITPKLTLNLGLRYEFDQPIYEANNKQANVLLDGTVEFAGKLPADAPAGSVVCPTRACYNATYNDFAPRLGFAYQFMPRFVVRGGYGITDYLEGTGANLRLFYNPPFEPSFELTGTAPSTTSGGEYFQVTNGFATSNQNLGGTTYRQWTQSLHPGVISEFSLTTEFQLNNFSSLKVGYVGQTGQHLIQAGAANQLAAPCVIGGVIQATPNSAACAAADPAPYQALVGQGGSIVQTLSEGMMNYNALQTTYRQRATKGLEYTVNYTYSRGMTNSTGFFGVPLINGQSPYAENYYNNHAEYGPVGEDVRNNLSAVAVYSLPFGRGRQFVSNINFFADEVVGGWKFATTAVAYSGFPLTIDAQSNNAYTNNKQQRANHVGKIHYRDRSANNWFGTDPSVQTAYVQPAAGTYGDATNGSERGPGYRQVDLSLFKDFTIYREHKIAFKTDFFNAFNITSLAEPSGSAIQAGSSNFGQITATTRSPQRQIQFSAKYSF
jgi:outer membrane receptor protein involved in Fe transport